MKPVYTIVIYERSADVFHKHPDTYIHHGSTFFDTGLAVELLQEYWLIALDVFRKFPYPKSKSEQTGWLSLLATEDMADAERLMEEYPWLREIYREMAAYMSEPKEVLDMFSEALKIMDRNTVQYMVEEQLDRITEQNEVIEKQQKQINSSNVQIMKQKEQINTQQAQLLQKDAEIARLKKLLQEKPGIGEPV